MTRRLSAAALLAVLLASCGSPPPREQVHEANRAELTEPRLLPPADQGVPGEIPVALHGRWGISLEDCAAGGARGDGLLEISSTGLRFHESLARVARVAESAPNLIIADFDYQGEGERWSNREMLELRDSTTLVRRDAGGTPRAEAFLYRKCDP
jgi:hypothetical protein